MEMTSQAQHLFNNDYQFAKYFYRIKFFNYHLAIFIKHSFYLFNNLLLILKMMKRINDYNLIYTIIGKRQILRFCVDTRKFGVSLQACLIIPSEASTTVIFWTLFAKYFVVLPVPPPKSITLS